MPLNPGQILNGRYRIVKLLGQGGFGSVYRAWDMNLNKACALKENLDTSEDSQRQFWREAQILSDLTHPNLPRVIDHFVIAGQGQYLVMDYVDGEDLDVMLRRLGGPVSQEQAIGWISQICDALNYLHRHNPPIIHRDVKPANIKITSDDRAVLVDFGISKVFDPGTKTALGARAVTAGFSPVEQYGAGVTDGRTDQYALAATMYFLLTGRQPPESIHRSTEAILIPPRELNRTISPQVEGAILKAMEMQPTRRFGSIADFKTALHSVHTVPPTYVMPENSARVAPAYADPYASFNTSAPPAAAVRPARSLPVLWIAGAAVLLLLCLAGGGSLAAMLMRPSAPTATRTPAIGETQTALALVATATYTEAPTATSEPVPTATPVDTPTPVPTATSAAVSTLSPAEKTQQAAGQASDRATFLALPPDGIFANPDRFPLLLAEPFSDNSREWETGTVDDEYNLGETSITGGKLHFDFTARQGFIRWQLTPIDSASDFYFSGEAQQLGDFDYFAYGLIFGYQEGASFHYLKITAGTSYEIYLRQPDQSDQWNLLAEGNIPSSYKQAGANHVAVIMQGNLASFYFNGLLLDSFQLDTYKPGRTGVAFEAFNEGERVVLEFDNLILYGFP